MIRLKLHSYIFLMMIILTMGCYGTNNQDEDHLSNININYIPRKEFPRPDFERSNWINLNGIWQFKFDPFNEGINNQWYLQPSIFTYNIIVPFPWQSSLSGIGTIPDEYEEYPITIFPRAQRHYIGWYMRTFYTPEWVNNGKHVFLNFGAVDWEADIWVNGNYIGKHEGGYTPFSFDITNYLLPFGYKNTVVVRAYDPGNSDNYLVPIGKQGDMWYTPVSGIWQTVYLEERGDIYFENYRVNTDPDTGAVSFIFHIINTGQEKNSSLSLNVYDDSGTVYKKLIPTHLEPGENDITVNFSIARCQPWTPEDPHLYRFKV